MEYYIEDINPREEVWVEEIQVKALLKSERGISINYMEGQGRGIPETQLWCAVIHKAVDDLFFLPESKNTQSHYAIEAMREAKNIRKSAYNFLFLNSPLFAEYRRFVFECAGIGVLKMSKLRRRADRFEAENS